MSPRPSTRSIRSASGPRRRHSLLLLGAVVLASHLAACDRTAEKPGMPGHLQVDIETSPLSIDPRFATDAISSRIGEMVFDAMVKLDQRGRLIGSLAETIERPSATELVFHLRPDVRFSDGRRLTARDVQYTYDFVGDPRNLSPKRAALEPIKSVRALDEYTVAMTTKRPYAPALESAMLGVVPFGTPGGAGGLSAPAGSGPFEIGRFVRDEMLGLERNPFRVRPGSAPRGIIFKVVPDPTVRALELAEGVCDFSENNVEPYLLDWLRRRPGLKIVRSPGIAYQYLAFNFSDPRLRDIRVRRAIAYAIDRDAIIGSILRGEARAASGMLAPENWAYEGNVAGYPYDPANSKRLLDEAGYPAGPNGMRPLDFVYKSTPEGRRLGEAFQAMLKRIGVTLSIRSNEWATFYSDIQRGNFDLTSLQWVGITEPHHYYMVFDSAMTPPNGMNRGRYSNPEMDRLVEEADTTLDPELRRAIYSRVQKLAADDLPYVSLWWQDNVAVMSQRLTGFTPFPNGSLSSLATITLIGGGRAVADGSEACQ